MAAALPKGEFFKFAKMMGLDLSDSSLGPEAEEIWNKLNHMSENDPIAYSNFIAAQKEQAVEDKQQAPPGQGEEEQQQQFFRPKAGFSVECASTGGDGIKVRDISGHLSGGKKVFINVCGHDVIEPAKNPNNAPIYDGFASVDGLEIPLYLGHVRSEEAHSIYIDAIFHPAIVAYCSASGKSNSHFKNQIVDLAMEWTQKEKGIQLSASWAVSFYQYNGGLGENRSVPVMCPVDKSGKNASTKGSTTAPSISPQSILKHVLESKESDESLADASLRIKTEVRPKGGGAGGKVGIADLKSIVKPSASSDAETGKKKPEAKVAASTKKGSANIIRKGFLSDPKNAGALYPDGSSEGKDGATGGSFARIMGKCQVVNVGADNSVSQASSPGPNSNPSSSQVPQTQKQSRAPNPDPNPNPNLAAKKDVQPTYQDLQAMDRLAREFDSDWGSSGKKDMYAGDSFSDSLAEVAKMIGFSSDLPTAGVVSKDPPAAAAERSASSGRSYSNVRSALAGVKVECTMGDNKDITLSEETIGGELAVVVNFTVSSDVEALAAMALEVADDAVLCALGEQRLRLTGFPRKLARTRAKAALSRKKMAMKIIVHYT